MNILEFLNQIKFGPEYGDWSGAIVAIVFGCVSFAISVLSGLMIYYRWKKENKLMRIEQERLIKVEEDQNYLELTKRYDDIWDKLTRKGIKHLHISYKDTKKLKEVLGEEELARAKTSAWQLIKLLSDIEFLYCKKQDSLFWKRWEAIFQFVFSKPFIQMAFIRNKKDFQVNSSFVEYVENIMSNSVEKETQEDNIEHVDEKKNYKVKFNKVG